MDAVRQQIRQFMEETLLVNFDEEITEDTDLFKAGVIESRDYLSILRFLQQDLKVEMTDEDLFMNVLVSLSGITEFVHQKQGGVRPV
ncbi:phosphopantetheine-binding protein [Streptomyces sp. NPDC048514]|uniref:phosphopantetheine-binding protein n=1 Tax=Streptomyces sp. NPDC048514 TaxID=3365564 RepID=UPI003715A0AE